MPDLQPDSAMGLAFQRAAVVRANKVNIPHLATRIDTPIHTGTYGTCQTCSRDAPYVYVFIEGRGAPSHLKTKCPVCDAEAA